MSDAAQKTTPLYEEHVRLGAKMIPFGDWIMPVQYSSIMEEHQAVRNNVGVFDISHMGQLVATGPAAGAWLNEMLTNNIDKLEVGSGQYTFLLNERGGIIDDLIVYRTGPEEFLLVVNASRVEDDFGWLKTHVDRRGLICRIAAPITAAWRFRGHASWNCFTRCWAITSTFPRATKSRRSISQQRKGAMMIARTGYTGEDGVEVFFPAKAKHVVLESGARKRKRAWNSTVRLGARDTLRLEMCYPLNGSDLSPEQIRSRPAWGFSLI